MYRLFVVAILVVLGTLGYRRYRGTQAYEWSGTVEARAISVGSRTGGRVKEVLAHEGDSVKTGQPLLLLEAGDLPAQKLIAQGTDWRFLKELKRELKG